MLCGLSEKTQPTSLEVGRRLSSFNLQRVFDPNASVLDVVGDVPHQCLNWPDIAQRSVTLHVRRDDLIHPLLSGNKLYKLFGYLRNWAAHKPETALCSFGGAFSNHLHALAAFGKLSGIRTLGIVRGQRPQQLSPTLRDLDEMGMQLVFVERHAYKQRNTSGFRQQIENACGVTGRAYWIPEGGDGELGRLGCKQLGRHLASLDYDVIALACGTGTSFLGIRDGIFSASSSHQHLLGVSALRNSFEILRKIQFEKSTPSWMLTNEFHFGGFAKSSAKLDTFMHEFESITTVPVEKVYTGKLFYALATYIERGVIPEGSRVLAVHSGGLQGKRKLGQAT